ncbi:MAG: SMC-Scp complex subunit ScpB [Erysipelotrichaceae bacterium]|nr:SMC-Scp complex subunit ScpB [Erysipelotrichaceae bacterium]
MAEYECSIKALIEGLLYIAGEEGLSVIQLQSALQESTREEIESCLYQLQKECSDPDRGVELACYASRWKLVSKECVFDYAKRLYQDIKAPTLSSAALETLAIIAYRQPITRVEIEEIRGVSCEAMLKKLQLRGLIEAKERANAVGNPLLYTVTDGFMDAFALDSLEQLPEIEKPREQKELFSSNLED